MAVAGKVAPVPKGNWASDVEYEKLNLVKYNNKLFIAKQASTNRTPVGDASDQYWMLSLEGISDVFTGAIAQTAGSAGLVPALSAGDQNKLLRGDGSWGYAKIEEVKPTTGATAGQIPIAREVGGAIQFQMEDVPSSGHGVLNQNGTLMTQEKNLQFLYADVADVPEHEEGGVTIEGKTTVDGRGHKIKNASGTAMTRRESLQGKGTIKVIDDSTNNATIFDTTADEIDAEDWYAMTAQEQEAYAEEHFNFDIVDYDEADEFVNVDLMEKLWENPNPSQAFTSQNITLSSDDYDFLLTLYYVSTSDVRTFSVIAPKGEAILLGASATGAGGSISLNRTCAYSSDTELSMGNATRATGATAGTTDNTVMVPLVIYGIKKRTTVKVDAIAANVKASVDYSTEEHVIGKWIDGSDLYEKTIDCGALPNASVKTVAHNISNINHIVSINGIGIGSNSIPLPWVSSVNPCTIYADYRVITIGSSDDISGYNAYVTLRYTKSS